MSFEVTRSELSDPPVARIEIVVTSWDPARQPEVSWVVHRAPDRGVNACVADLMRIGEAACRYNAQLNDAIEQDLLDAPQDHEDDEPR